MLHLIRINLFQVKTPRIQHNKSQQRVQHHRGRSLGNLGVVIFKIRCKMHKMIQLCLMLHAHAFYLHFFTPSTGNFEAVCPYFCRQSASKPAELNAANISQARLGQQQQDNITN